MFSGWYSLSAATTSASGVSTDSRGTSERAPRNSAKARLVMCSGRWRADAQGPGLRRRAEHPQQAQHVRHGLQPPWLVVDDNGTLAGGAASGVSPVLVEDQRAGPRGVKMALYVLQSQPRVGDDAVPVVHQLA